MTLTFAKQEMRSYPFILIAALLVGCTTRSPDNKPATASSGPDHILLLDNAGGFSHAGRRIELLADGTVIDIRYTDSIGDEIESRGTYQRSDGVLNLRFGDRGNQRLIRVQLGGDTCWVYPGEVEELREPESSRLRQTSLKQKGEQ